MAGCHLQLNCKRAQLQTLKGYSSPNEAKKNAIFLYSSAICPIFMNGNIATLLSLLISSFLFFVTSQWFCWKKHRHIHLYCTWYCVAQLKSLSSNCNETVHCTTVSYTLHEQTQAKVYDCLVIVNKWRMVCQWGSIYARLLTKRCALLILSFWSHQFNIIYMDLHLPAFHLHKLDCAVMPFLERRVTHSILWMLPNRIVFFLLLQKTMFAKWTIRTMLAKIF